MNQNTSHIRWPKAKDLVFHACEHTHTYIQSTKMLRWKWKISSETHSNRNSVKWKRTQQVGQIKLTHFKNMYKHTTYCGYIICYVEKIKAKQFIELSKTTCSWKWNVMICSKQKKKKQIKRWYIWYKL